MLLCMPKVGKKWKVVDVNSELEVVAPETVPELEPVPEPVAEPAEPLAPTEPVVMKPKSRARAKAKSKAQAELEKVEEESKE